MMSPPRSRSRTSLIASRGWVSTRTRSVLSRGVRSARTDRSTSRRGWIPATARPTTSSIDGTCTSPPKPTSEYVPAGASSAGRRPACRRSRRSRTPRRRRVPPVRSPIASTASWPASTAWSAPSSIASARHLRVGVDGDDPARPEHADSWTAIWPTPPTPTTTAVVPGVQMPRDATHRVVGGQPCVGVRRHVARLQAVRQPDELALGDQQPFREATVDRQAGEAVAITVHVIAAPAGDAQAAAVGRVNDHRVADRDRRDEVADLFHPARVLVAEHARQGDAGGLHQAVDRVQVGRADARPADTNHDVVGSRDHGRGALDQLQRSAVR